MRLVGIILALSISACAHVDTGQVDYRVAEPFDPVSATGASPRDCTTQTCRWHSNLDRKYVPSHEAFVSPNVYSVELEQAFIGTNLSEGHVLGHQFGKHGEYAILANAFEFAADGSTKFIQAPEYGGETGSANSTKLKLVYFGDDIAKRQPFNFSNVPLMPRAQYHGGSVGIQIVVMEIDGQSSPVKALLGTLAEFGKSSIPGPPQATKILFDLGDSLMKGSQDDRLFDYRFVLSNGASVAADGTLGPAATFSPGRYILRRLNERTKTMKWDDLKYNYNTGRLYRFAKGKTDHGANEADKYDEVRDEFYLVLNVRKYADTTEAENIALADWTEFRAVVRDVANAKNAPLEAVTKDFMSLLGYQRSRQWKAELATEWGKVARALDTYSTRTIGLTSRDDFADCPVERDKALLARDVAERSVRDAVRMFLANYQAGQDKMIGEGENAQPEFKEEDREALVSMAARHFMPWSSEESKAKFANSASFATAFLGNDELITLATTTAASRSRTISDCDQIKGRLAS